MTYINRFFVINIVIALIVAGCANLPSDFEEPSVSIINIDLRNSSGLAPQFDIALRITNPNREPLDISGMSYEIYLEGNKVVSGVSNNFPVIEPYSTVDVNVSAMVSLLGSINFLRGLTTRSESNLDYELRAKIDIGRSYPHVNINKSGVISF
jgi:LEA14-like dessication related protein